MISRLFVIVFLLHVYRISAAVDSNDPRVASGTVVSPDTIAHFLSVATLDGDGPAWEPCPDTQPLADDEESSQVHPDPRIIEGLAAPLSIPFAGRTRKTTKSPSRSDGSLVQECLSVSVPAFWAAPSKGSIQVFVRRVFIGPTPPLGQLWLLNGGPGAPGSQLIDLGIGMLPWFNNSITIYLPDHRGVGNSSALPECPDAFRSVPAACAQYILQQQPLLPAFGTTEAARDIAFLIALTRQNITEGGKSSKTVPGMEPVWVYGGSYGTYWNNRYLVVISSSTEGWSQASHPDGAILDGVCPPDQCRLMAYDVNHNAVVMDTLTYCQRDDQCNNHFTSLSLASDTASVPRPHYSVGSQSNDGDPVRAALSLLHSIQSGTSKCANALNVSTESFIDAVARVSSWDTRIIIPATIFRMLRCSDADIEVLKRVPWPTVTPVNHVPPPYPGESQSLQYNVMFGELWAQQGLFPFSSLSCESLRAVTDSLLAATFLGALACPSYSVWPRYEPEYVNQYPDRSLSAPILVLNGDLDQATPYFWAQHYSQSAIEAGLDAQLYVVPYSTHVTLVSSVMNGAAPNATSALDTCGLRIIRSFIQNDGGQVDSSCVQNVAPIDFDVSTQWSKEVSLIAFGTTDLWGDQ